MAGIGALAPIFLACGVNNWALEMMISKKRNQDGDPGSGPLLTLLQFLFVAIVTFPGVACWNPKTFFLKPRMIPIQHYATQAALFFAMSFLNNAAFGYAISQPVHMVVRSSNLIVTCLFGYFLGKRYSWRAIACVVCVSAGVFVATAAEALVGDASLLRAVNITASAHPEMFQGKSGCCTPDAWAHNVSGPLPQSSQPEQGFWTWCLGVGILLLVLLVSAALSQFQDWLRLNYPRCPEENVFYVHVMSLPFFFPCIAQLSAHARMWSNSALVGSFVSTEWMETLLPGLHHTPLMWALLVINVVSQYYCIQGVYALNTRADVLTVNMVLTLRKVFSLILSILFFGNTFTLYHCIGTGMVFGGAVVYSLVTSAPKSALGKCASPTAHSFGAGTPLLEKKAS